MGQNIIVVYTFLLKKVLLSRKKSIFASTFARYAPRAMYLLLIIPIIKLLKYISGFVAAVAILLFLLMMSMRLDVVKHRVASYVSTELTEKYGIPFDVEEVEVRSLNDVRLRNVTLCDLSGDTVLSANEARVYLQTKRLLDGEVRINTLVFAAPDIRLNRVAPGEELNIQFIIDILNNDKKKEKSSLDLRINQLLVYDGRFSYDVLSELADDTRFDPNHISVSDFACNLSLKKLCGNELDLYIRSISGKERCGFELDKLKADVAKSGNDISLSNFELRTPSSKISADRIGLCADSLWGNIRVTGGVQSDFFALSDLTPFIDIPYGLFAPLAFSVDGFYSKDSADVALAAFALDNSFGANISMTALAPFVEQMQGRLIVDECYASESQLHRILDFAGLDSLNYDILGLLGDVYLLGDVSFDKNRIAGNASLDCRSGDVVVEGVAVADGRYELSLNGKDLKLQALTGVQGLEECEVNVKACGNIKDNRNLADVSGTIDNLVYNGYSYAPIGFSGKYAVDDITARIVADDPNARIQLSARYGVDDEKMLKLTLKADKFSPVDLNLVKMEQKQDFSFTLNGEYIDYGAGKTVVNAKIDNLLSAGETDTTFVRNLYVSDNRAGDDRLFVVTSDFASASIYGNFDFKSLVNSITDIIKSHLPVLDIASANSTPTFVNDFYYDLSIKDSSPLTKMLDLPVTVLEPSRIKGVFNERENIFTIDAAINKIDFYGGLVRSFNVDGKSGLNGLDLNVQFNKPLVKNVKDFDYDNLSEDIVVRLNANVASDNIRGIVNWNNFKTDEVMMGMVRLDAALARTPEHELELTAKIHNDSVIHKNKVWYVNEGTVAGKMDRLIVENIGLTSDIQDLRIDGVIGKEQSDSLNAYLKNFDIATVFDLIKFRILDFGGKATGTAHLTGLLSAPNAASNISVTDFSIDGAKLGSGEVFVGWEDASKSILLDADIYNSENKLSTVNGFLSQVNDTITLKIDANDLNVAFLEKKLGSFLSEMDGTGSGKVHLHGQWRSVDLDGAVALYCSAKVNANNTRYYFTGDSLRFSPGTIAFDKARLYDRYGNRGYISGPLKHRSLGSWTCDFNVEADDMLVYDTDDFGSLPFYGTVFATGSALIKSDSTGFLLKANAKSMPGSRFVYNSNETSGARDNSFVAFTDNSKRNKKELVTEQKPAVKDAYNKTASKLTLDFMLDVNDALEVKVYTNLQTDDYISLYGHGPINAIYNDKTGFSMKGHLNLARGAYKFTIQDIFPKVFEISKGSTLVFNGDPYKADLNLKAKYLVPSASLSDLTTEIAKRKTVKVNCVMNITGSLASPDLAFDLELPEGSEEERELLASVASTPDQKNMQFVYLLGVGKFYTFDTNAAQAGETNSSTAVESLISNTISGQLNNMLGKIINNGNWDISGNISTSERGWNSMEVEGMLRGRLLDNRLQINGNLGYRENPIANRNFIGDFELLWLLSPNYNWNIKAYSKTNDRYFSKTDLTTQGIGTSILFEFDRWKWWGKKKDKKRENKQPADAENAQPEQPGEANDE